MSKKDLLTVKKDDNGIIEIIINEDCKIKDFIEKIREYNLDNNIEVFISSSKLVIPKGLIHLFKKENSIFTIYKNNKKIYISEKVNGTDKIIIDSYYDKSFSITNLKYDLKGNVLDNKSYVFDGKQESYFNLYKKEALLMATHVLDNLDDCLLARKVYRNLNLLPNYEYNPVISDGVISLSVSNEDNAKCVNERKCQTFEIVLNETRENLGYIRFDYKQNMDCEDSFGNVIYEITDQFQNKGYATRALSLLKQIVKNNNFNGNKDLYFWIWHTNEASKKVVLNNGGELLQENKPNTEIDFGTGYTYRIKI